MKKLFFMFTIILMMIIFGCVSSVTISESESELDEALLEQNLGNYVFSFNVLDNKGFDYRMTNLRRGIIEDDSFSAEEKEVIVAQIDSCIFEENKYLSFAIRHGEPTIRKVETESVSFTNTNGQNITGLVLSSTYKVTQSDEISSMSFYITQWIIQVDKAITLANYGTVLPLTFSIEFMENQIKSYSVLPEK